MNRRMIMMTAVAALLAGCGNANKTVRYADLLTGDVVVVANGKSLIKGELEKDLRFRMVLEVKRNPRLTVAQSNELEKRLYDGAVDHFIERLAYEAAAREMHVQPGTDDLARVREAFARRQTQGRQKWDKFIAKFDRDLVEPLNRELMFEALRAKVDATLRERSRREPSADEISVMREKIRKYNARATEVEVETYRKATNVWKSVVADKAPDAFEKVVACYATNDDQHVSSDAHWGPIGEETLKDESQLAVIVPGMKVGDITPPVEGDNGLVILKLKSRERMPTTDGSMNMQYAFAKLFFALPEFGDELTDAEISKQLADKLAKETAKKSFDAYKNAIHVTYPKGKVVFR